MNMNSRKERRAEAKKNKTAFEPQYTSGTRTIQTYDEKTKSYDYETITVGGNPRTYEETFGVGNERFNNKFTTIKEVENLVEATE